MTRPSGKKGIANVIVSAVDPNFSSWINGLYTDSNGNYSFNVPEVTCKVYFGSSPSMKYSAPEWYDNRSNFQVADLVTVTALRTTFNINARFEIGGAISGRVTDASGNGIADVYVQVYDHINNTIVFSGATTNSEGFYGIPLAAGNYKVRFSPRQDSGNYTLEWYNNKSDFPSADTVSVKKRINSRETMSGVRLNY